MKKFLKYFILITVTFGLVLTIFDFINLKNVVKENSWIEEYIQISAHRGGALLNPENTKKAFDYVIKETNYTDIVEIDLRLTKDNVIVINHDSDINRMALEENSESIEISEHNYSELVNYNLGRNFVNLNNMKPYLFYSVEEARNEGLTLMTLNDFFAEYENIRHFKVFLEIKESGDKARYIADEIRQMTKENKFWKERVMIISFEDELINYIADTYKDLYVGALGDKVAYQIGFSKVGLDVFYNPNFHSIQVPYNEEAKEKPLGLDSKRLIKSFKERNQLVVYWGVNNREDMIKLIDVGVHVITTDTPDLLAALLQR